MLGGTQAGTGSPSAGHKGPEPQRPARGTHTDACDQTPSLADHHPAENAPGGTQASNAKPVGANTATGIPAPTANAMANQVPEPPPDTPACSTDPPQSGRQTAGHGPDGNATSADPGPPATAAASTDRDRTANAARPAERGTNTTDAPAADAAHDDADETAKAPSREPGPQPQTVAATAASTPRAQPTTSRPEANTDTTAGDTNPDTTDREPANATTPDTATTPGRRRAHTTEAGRPPPDSLFHAGRDPPRKGRLLRRRRAVSALSRAGGDPARVKRQGGFSTERARLASELARPVASRQGARRRSSRRWPGHSRLKEASMKE
jgi:hypothetical protein